MFYPGCSIPDHNCSLKLKIQMLAFTETATFLNSLRSDTKNVETPVRQSPMIEPERFLTGNAATLNKVWFLVFEQLQRGYIK